MDIEQLAILSLGILLLVLVLYIIYIKRKTKPISIRRKEVTAIQLLCCCPLVPFIWLYYSFKRPKSLYKKRPPGLFQRCCVLRRPDTRNQETCVTEEYFAASEGMSWYLHSYMACLQQYGCCILNFTKRMTVGEAIKRYVEAPRKTWEELLRKIVKNHYMNFLIEYLSYREPKFYFRILPAGSIREGFGCPLPSTSILASDYDLMLVPDGIFVYEENATRDDGFPASFITVDDPNQNPDRPEGFLWLQLVSPIKVWKELCYEKLTRNGLRYYLSQLVVLQMIEKHIGDPIFLELFNKFCHASETSNDYTIECDRQGPALNISITKQELIREIPCMKVPSKAPQKILDADFTLALRCPNFPEAGKYFFKRRHVDGSYGTSIYWPSQDIVTKIENLGCHVVPKPSSKRLVQFQEEQVMNSFLGASAVLEWRYSFSQAEMVLADNIPGPARTSFLALKATVKTHINNVLDKYGFHHKISSYALKTILYFEVEGKRPDYWTRENIEEEFFWVIFRSLQTKVIERRCPHYWIEKLNLFSEMKESDFYFILERMLQIEASPVKHIASEWLEWNRYVQMNCCASCVNEAHYERIAHDEDVKPIRCCYCPSVLRHKKTDDLRRAKINYNDVIFEVY